MFSEWHFDGVPTQVVLYFLAGCLTWTLSEYWIHRSVFHGSSRRNIFNQEHYDHHAKRNYFAPAIYKFAAGCVIMAMLYPISVRYLGKINGVSYSIGFVFFYLYYEYIHRQLHIVGPSGPYTTFLRLHHFYHHFADASTNHGVTSPVWDLIFGTYVAVDHIIVPRRYILPWLVKNEGTTEILPQYTKHYSLRQKHSKTPELPPY